MVGSRTLTAAAGLAASIAVSVLAWVYLDTLLLFVLVPFVPLLFRGKDGDQPPPRKECPTCGYATRNPEYDHCPRDGTELQGGESGRGRTESRPEPR